MKIQYKMFKTLKNEPVETQIIDGKVVEIHYMNDTPFLASYAGRGRFAEWTSDGQTFKLIVEKGYYEAMKGFYEEDINKIWIDFLLEVGRKYRKVTSYFMMGATFVYLIIAVLGIFIIPEAFSTMLIASLGFLLVGNIIQARYLRKYIAGKNDESRKAIHEALGEERYNDLLEKQETYYQSYFKFEESNLEDAEKIEQDNENEGENDGKESN